MNEPIIDLKPAKDPTTGAEVWTAPWESTAPAEMVVADSSGNLSVQGEPVALPHDRFAGDPKEPQAPHLVDWAAADQVNRSGQTVSLSPTGELVVSDSQGTATDSVRLPGEGFAAEPPEIGSWRDTTVPGAPPLPSVPPVSLTADGGLQVAGQPDGAGMVTLTSDRFASGLGPSSTQRRREENQSVASLRDSQVRWVKQLTHTSRVQGMPSGSPTGWLYRPRPNRYGDQLVCVLAFHPTTMLYHSHYWRFEADFDGRGPKAIDLPRYLGRYPHLTHHKAHLYTGDDGTAVLCLSHRVSGGMPTLETALVQTLKWADGTGEVVRGRPFPYQ